MNHSFPTTAVRRVLPAAAVLLLAAAAVPAHAAARDTFPGNWLQLTVTRGASPSADGRGTLLLCDPPQGHSRAVEACGQLAAVDGDPGGLTAAQDAVCAMVYAPVTARASGRWNGRPVEYSRTFGNACELAALTGAVFALDGADEADEADEAGEADVEAGKAGDADAPEV
ncbi:SSI family serine proteinase inhibitor [Streptomyces phaeofaciens]|uniref:SSI family serine proteinase inhibitor n=1 Tax=Streptomyces phaeofaciens TaxID=68254 RepID=UPI0036CF9234